MPETATRADVGGALMARQAGGARPDFPVREVGAPELIAELSQVQATIRIADPRCRADEMSTRNPKLLALFRRERRILRELRRRQTLLRQGIDWTTPSAAQHSGRASCADGREAFPGAS